MRAHNHLMTFPGLVDAHVHLRVPGGEHKEDYHTGSAAALAGGFTSIMAMPNTTPPITTVGRWRAATEQAARESLCDVALFAGASSTNFDELHELSRHARALKLYMDLTFGELRVEGAEALLRIAREWPSEKVLALHAEDNSVKIGISLAEKFQRRVHFCHISRKEEIEWIAAAKEKGLQVTCEVTPHHLFLNDSDAQRLGALGDMRPKLAGQRDVDALWEHIDSTIDCVASDHAPHTLSEKQNPKNSPPGVPGLESTLPLLLTAAAEGRLSYERIIELLAVNPRKIYGLPEQPDTWVEVDTQAKYHFPDHPLYTKCGWSPFADFPITGKIMRVVLRGREVVTNGIVNDYCRKID